MCHGRASDWSVVSCLLHFKLSYPVNIGNIKSGGGQRRVEEGVDEVYWSSWFLSGLGELMPRFDIDERTLYSLNLLKDFALSLSAARRNMWIRICLPAAAAASDSVVSLIWPNCRRQSPNVSTIGWICFVFRLSPTDLPPRNLSNHLTRRRRLMHWIVAWRSRRYPGS